MHTLNDVIIAIFMHTTKSKVSFQPGHSKDHNEGAKMSFGEMKKEKVCNKCRRSEKSHSSPAKFIYSEKATIFCEISTV